MPSPSTGNIVLTGTGKGMVTKLAIKGTSQSRKGEVSVSDVLQSMPKGDIVDPTSLFGMKVERDRKCCH